ncbi:MAG: copper-translocating P-type ATPase [Candidatus Nanoarchaeia archaeon]|jgi:Cu+-exporting ATPase|nr:copper-translocating P-type ATPase [Candidatus Nanoarchaeia archaeon]|tara:strand:- start:34 stop:1986 length:1953 start_codon:yes stop_codon:yes gene_type:complete
MAEQNNREESVEEMEIRSWKNKLVWAWIITIPLLAFMYSEMVFGLGIVSMKTTTLILLALGFPIIFVLGWSTIRSGLRGFYKLQFSMDSLISLGTIIAYFTGFFAYFELTQDYSGVSSMIMTIFITGKYIEARAKGKASNEIKKLLELGAKKAIVLRDKKEMVVDISEVLVGDIMVIKPGEKIPTDGIVTKGESAVDESMVTGESLPSDKSKGCTVIGATINQDGILYVKATKVGEDTFLSHIIELVEEAQGTKVPIQKVADSITKIFVPIILILALGSFIGWFAGSGDLSKSIGIAVAVLVIACPCSLGLATPITLMVGSGMGAKRGILFRKGEAIQTMKEIKYVVFDKTGTITKGTPELTDVYTAARTSEKDLLSKVASIEKLSEHPVGKAIVNYADLKSYKKVSGFKIVRGKGVLGTINRKKILIGTERLMREHKVSLGSVQKVVESYESDGKTTMIVAESGRVIGAVAVADTVKEESKKVIAYLKRRGYRTVMLTGDNERTAKAIAREVGINKVVAQVLPEDKSNEVKKIQKFGMVAFVGDGINDAPALKQANVGIAMGTGTDIAIEAGDIVLAKGSLRGVAQAIVLSKATFGKIKQNLFWAFAYNIVAIPLAVGGLLHPVVAEIAMALSSITVVSNANLLRRARI